MCLFLEHLLLAYILPGWKIMPGTYFALLLWCVAWHCSAIISWTCFRHCTSHHKRKNCTTCLHVEMQNHKWRASFQLMLVVCILLRLRRAWFQCSCFTGRFWPCILTEAQILTCAAKLAKATAFCDSACLWCCMCWWSLAACFFACLVAQVKRRLLV